MRQLYFLLSPPFAAFPLSAVRSLTKRIAIAPGVSDANPLRRCDSAFALCVSTALVAETLPLPCCLCD